MSDQPEGTTPRDTGELAEVPAEQRLDVDDAGDHAPEDLSDVEEGDVVDLEED